MAAIGYARVPDQQLIEWDIKFDHVVKGHILSWEINDTQLELIMGW
jgi:hypothetical protein